MDGDDDAPSVGLEVTGELDASMPSPGDDGNVDMGLPDVSETMLDPEMPDPGGDTDRESAVPDMMGGGDGAEMPDLWGDHDDDDGDDGFLRF